MLNLHSRRAPRSISITQMTGAIALAFIATIAAAPLQSSSQAQAAADVTAVYFDSVYGEPLANGRTHVIHEADALYVGTTSYAGGSDIEVWFQLDTEGTYPWIGTWRVGMTGVSGVPFEVGDYAVGGSTGIDLKATGHTSACDFESGQVVVHEISYDAGDLTAISASFGGKCDYGDEQLFGELRFHASSGFGAAKIAPIKVDFGRSVNDTRSDAESLVVTSIGTEALDISSAEIGGADPGAFSVVSNECAGRSLVPGDSCRVDVVAEPTAKRTYSGRLRIHDDTYRGKRVAPLSVEGWEFSWGKIERVTLDYGNSWGGGHALAATTVGDEDGLHAAFGSNVWNGRYVTDKGPFAPVLYRRAGLDYDGWGPWKRINPKRQHGTRSAIAASGHDVHIAWVQMNKYVDYKPKASRVLYIRSNRSDGDRDAWASTVRLTASTGRVDIPTVAADGDNVYVAYTNSKTGKVQLAVSRDRGRTWRKQALGSTWSKTVSGYSAAPVVAAGGGTVAVSWWAGKTGLIKARVSADGGTTWTTTAKVGSSIWPAAVDARGDRVALAMVSGKHLYTRLWERGSWHATNKVPGLPDTRAQMASVALRGDDRLAVVYPACLERCFYSGKGVTRSHLIWRYSADDGASWTPATYLARSGPDRRANDAPSMVWPPSGPRSVLWDGWDVKRRQFRVYSIHANALDIAGGLRTAESATPAGEAPFTEHHRLLPRAGFEVDVPAVAALPEPSVSPGPDGGYAASGSAPDEVGLVETRQSDRQGSSPRRDVEQDRQPSSDAGMEEDPRQER